ncbi:hypothetical protein N9D63_04600 [Opitutales bacterium]|nr:hypothetical protein [Opitutales bacterium]
MLFAPPATPSLPTVVIARSGATRQSSDRVGQPPHRPGIPQRLRLDCHALPGSQ